jgi:spermidine/putrescine transport system substrate-binding protein
VNSKDPEEVDKAAHLLIQWKRYIAKFESEQYKSGIASAEYLVVQGYSGDILQVMQENPYVSFAYPKEGTMLSIDYAAIPKEAPQAKLANEFINFLLEPKNAASNMEFTLYLSPNLSAYQNLPKELQQNIILFPSDEMMNTIEIINNLEESQILYTEAWDKVKAAS